MVKAARNDNIIAEIPKSGREAIVDWMTELVQKVWRTKQVLQEWKMRHLCLCQEEGLEDL